MDIADAAVGSLIDPNGPELTKGLISAAMAFADAAGGGGAKPLRSFETLAAIKLFGDSGAAEPIMVVHSVRGREHDRRRFIAKP
jgi:hypothetical protein